MNRILLMLRLLCPGQEHLAEPVAKSSRRHMLHPAWLVSTMAVESRCGNVTNKRTGATGPMQILPGGSAALGHSARELRNFSLNIELGARHLARMMVLCGTLYGALHLYHGGQTCSGWRGDEYVRRWVEAERSVRR